MLTEPSESAAVALIVIVAVALNIALSTGVEIFTEGALFAIVAVPS